MSDLTTERRFEESMSCSAMNENPATLQYQNAGKQNPSPMKTYPNSHQSVAQRNLLVVVTGPAVATLSVFMSR